MCQSQAHQPFIPLFQLASLFILFYIPGGLPYTGMPLSFILFVAALRAATAVRAVIAARVAPRLFRHALRRRRMARHSLLQLPTLRQHRHRCALSFPTRARYSSPAVAC